MIENEVASWAAQLAGLLAAADPFCCDRDGLAELVALSGRLRGWLDGFDAKVAIAARRLAADGQCEGPGVLLAGEGRRARRDAEAAARRSRACEDLPAFHDALTGGEVSAGHVDALANLTTTLDDHGRCELKTLEDALVGSAKTKAVEEFARECQDLGRILSRDDGVSRLADQKRQRRLRRWVDRATGMCHTHLQLDPEADAAVASALDAAVSVKRAEPQEPELTWEQLQVDALVGLITGAQTLDRRVPEVTVLIDLDTLTSGLHDHGVCETGDGNPLPPATVRRLGCDANVVPVVLNGAGVVLDVGREQRLATREQRRALRAMYRTCAFPGCSVRFDACRIHHVTWWEHGGRTDLHELAPLCSVHHHLVHEGGWTLTLHPDRTITLTRPDGTLHYHGITTDRTTTNRTHQAATESANTAVPTDMTIAPPLANSRHRGRPPPRTPAA